MLIELGEAFLNCLQAFLEISVYATHEINEERVKQEITRVWAQRKCSGQYSNKYQVKVYNIQMVEKYQLYQGEINSALTTSPSKLSALKKNAMKFVDENDIVEVRRLKLKEQLYQEKDPQQQIFLRNDITALRVMLKQINKRRHRKTPIYEIDTSLNRIIENPYYPPERNFDVVEFEKSLAVNDEASLVQMLKYEKQIIQTRQALEQNPELQLINANKATAYKL